MSDTVVVDGACELEIPIEGECGMFYKVNPTSEALTVQPTSEDVTYTPTADYFSEVTVEGIKGERTITENGDYDVLADKQVTVAVDPPVLDPLTATANGRYIPAHDGFSEVTVDVPPDTVPLNVAENGTYTRQGGYNPVTVSLPKAMTAEQIATGITDWGDLVIEAGEIVPCAFDNGGDRKNYPYSSITSVMAPNLITVGDYSFRGQTALRVVYLPKCKKIGPRAFYNTRALSILYAPLVEYIGDVLLDESGETPYRNEGFRQVVFPASVTRFPTLYTLQGCVDLEVVVFMFRPNALGSTTFYQCDKLRDIYVPWLEGELPNAPWGARKATIHYNTDYSDYEWDGYVCSPEVTYPPAIQ